MTAVFNGGGIYLRNVPIIGNDGSPPAAADTDGLFVAVEPVAAVRTAITIAAQPDVPRNITFGIIDANSSMAAGSTLQVYGTDAQDRALEETITATGTGTATYQGTKCFKTVTSGYYTATNTVTGAADTFQGGFGNVLGIGYDVGAVSDVKNRRYDSTDGAGTLSLVDSRLCTWTLSGGEIPDGAKEYFYDLQSTAD